MMLLEEIFKSKKAEHSDAFNLRIHRGLSWLKKSAELDQDLDLKFISLWVSFNALYAQDVAIMQDKQSLKQFLSLICQKDQEQKIDHILWQKFNHLIVLLLENPYIYQGFWDYQNQKISQISWKAGFDQEKKQAHRALQAKDSAHILWMFFNRLYTLHNQMILGGTTYNSAVNRKQLQDACTILAALLPTFIYIFLENSQSLDLVQPFYPMVQVS